MTMSAPPTTRVLRRAAVAATIGLVTSLVSLVVLAAGASAHVEVKPPEVEGGDFAEIAFTVPNELNDASTVKLVVDLPRDQPLASVQTSALPGWQITTKERKLAEPLELEGAPVTKVVSQITWKATSAGIPPGQFQDFPVSLGVLPTSGELTFKAVQTYSDGTVVKWDEIAADNCPAVHATDVGHIECSRVGGRRRIERLAADRDFHRRTRGRARRPRADVEAWSLVTYEP
jgi:uncharacterized protein YcnI